MVPTIPVINDKKIHRSELFIWLKRLSGTNKIVLPQKIFTPFLFLFLPLDTKKAAMIHSHSCFYAEKNCAAYIFSIAKLFPFLWENNFVLTLTRRVGLSLYRKGAATGWMSP